MNRQLRGLAAMVLVAGASVFGCKEKVRPDGTPPPPASSARTAACAGGGGRISDAVSAPFFPRMVVGGAAGAYCLDPQGDEKTYGEKAKLKIDELCTTALDGGCEEYKKFGVTRSVIVHYVADAGAGSVEVLFSEFAGDGAYAIYTTRLTGEIDPLDEHAARPLAAVAALPGASGALGTGKAYVQRGPYFVELTYDNDQETPAQLKKSADAILSALAQAVAAKLPAVPGVPAAAAALPKAERVPNGVMYFPKDVLGVPSAGPGAVGYYKGQGGQRYRLVSSAPGSTDRAKDVMHALRARPGALPFTTSGAKLGDEAVLVVLQPTPERPKIEWLVARKGDAVLGVGDEEFALPARLTKDEKTAKLRALIP
jgi:hypothetical protein